MAFLEGSSLKHCSSCTLFKVFKILQGDIHKYNNRGTLKGVLRGYTIDVFLSDHLKGEVTGSQ